MSPLSVILLTLSFISVMIYAGNHYTKINISREAWMIVTVISCIIFAVKYFADTLTKKKEE
jgi:formate hydrogenlyase subunit 4